MATCYICSSFFYRPCSWNERQAKLPSTDTTVSIFTVLMKMMMMNYDDDEETVYLCVETLLHISHTGGWRCWFQVRLTITDTKSEQQI